jgi:hypothetical protein
VLLRPSLRKDRPELEVRITARLVPVLLPPVILHLRHHHLLLLLLLLLHQPLLL